jgi:hypothetical protein
MVLPPGATWTIGLTVTPQAPGTIEHSVTVYATEPDAHPDNDSVTTKIVTS